MKRRYAEGLIIPDSHAKPGVGNDRFRRAGEFMVERQPNFVVDIGDSADVPSLGLYDIGKVSGEGRRYRDDLEAYWDSQEQFFKALHKYNNTHTRWKKKKYNPLLVKCHGNHEHRITRAANENPSMHGHISVKDLREEEFGWTVYPYLKPAEIEGIAFKHFHTSGVMGRAIGGDNHAASLAKKALKSTVVGHSHMRDYWETTDIMGKRVFGLIVGCYFSHEEHYTSENDRWWRGLVYLHDVVEGQAEPEFLAYDYIKDKYC